MIKDIIKMGIKKLKKKAKIKTLWYVKYQFFRNYFLHVKFERLKKQIFFTIKILIFLFHASVEHIDKFIVSIHSFILEFFKN